jgi:glycosyltransferase involved in cell wall biosynthesis
MARVTAVMPTTSARRPFWEGAIRQFLAQTYQDSELLILEESAGALDQQWPSRVKYVRMPQRALTTGRKRNVVNELAQSEIIVHFDDDDWFHPRRIEEQVSFLDTSGAKVVGNHDILYYRTEDQTFWQYLFQGHKPYATGTSLCYLKSWWEGHRFSDKSVGEDSDFWVEAKGANVMASRGLDQMIVARAHKGNTYHPAFGKSPFVAAKREMFPVEFLTEVGS